MSLKPIRSVKSHLDLSTARRRPSPSSDQAPWSPLLPPRQRERTPVKPGLTLKYGGKHHAFPDVPWPLSYDPEILDLDVLYHQFMKEEYGLSFIKFSERPPRRVLDLGSGLGSWILDAASQWKDTEFVGFDVVPIQPALETSSLEPQLRARIRWLHGNFLQPLPFDDNSFDYVRCAHLEKGIPEHLWLPLCQEISRVMAPSAAVEVIVHNIVFPYLPQIVTRGSNIETPTSPLSNEFRGFERHQHSALEKLFFGVFERRFVNVRPTSIVPSYMNIHFKHVTETPIQFHLIDAGDLTRQSKLSAWATEFAAWQGVLGCKESMWEEAVLLSKEKGQEVFDELSLTEEEEGFTMRQRFELHFERYEREMRGRTGMSIALERVLGWKEPGKEGRKPGMEGLQEDLEMLSKGQVALSQSASADVDMLRQISCFVGFKGDTL